MEPAQIVTWIFACIGAIAGLLYIEEWWRHRQKEKLEESSKSGRRPKPAWSHKYLPIVTIVCCVCFVVSGLIWLEKSQKEPMAQSVASDQLQWFLKVVSLQCQGPIRPDQSNAYPYRLMAYINGNEIDTFPHFLMAYRADTNILLGGGSTLLEKGVGSYSIGFGLMKLDVDGRATDLTYTDATFSAVSRMNFDVKELPVIQTNRIRLLRPLPGYLKVVYEITTNR